MQQICSTSGAFAALKVDRSVLTWGFARDGGDSMVVHEQLQGGVQQIYSTQLAFAGVKEDGRAGHLLH